MQDRPDKEALLEAVAAFLATDVLPALPDRALSFRVRIAAHVLGGLAREVRGEEARDAAHLSALWKGLGRSQSLPAPGEATRAAIVDAEAALAALVRDAELDDATLAALRTAMRPILAAQVLVGNPRFDLRDDPETPK